MPRLALFASAMTLCTALLAAPATVHAQPHQVQAAPEAGAGAASSSQARRGGTKGQVRQGKKRSTRQRIALEGSAESAAERDRRLRRECRGRPNAGACLGYAY